MRDKIITQFIHNYALDPDFRIYAQSSGLVIENLPSIKHQIFHSFQRLLRDEITPEAAFQRTVEKHPELYDCEAVDNPKAFCDETHLAVKELRVLLLADHLQKKPDNAEEILTQYQNSARVIGSVKHITEILKEAKSEYVERKERGVEFVKIGEWPQLSAMIGGFGPSRVSMILAKTGFGKTNLGLTLAMGAARDHAALYLNMEMSLYDIAKRLTVQTLGVQYDDFKRGNLFADVENILEYRKLYISDGMDLSIGEVAAIAKYYSKKNQIRFLFVDYDQKLKLTTSRESPEWKQLQMAMVEMESIAKNLGLHVCVLAQANNDGEVSGSKRSTYPVSTVLKFDKDESGQAFIRAVKNRFGVHNACISVDYRPESSTVKEIGMYIPEVKKL